MPFRGMRLNRVFMSTLLSSRDGRIRTGVLLLPRQADCQAFLHPELVVSSDSLLLTGNQGGRIRTGDLKLPELAD
jgi:hypothetical protein